MILITGVCGFVGFHLASKINNVKIIGIDSLDNYYDLGLKKDRLRLLKKKKNFVFLKLDLKNYKKLEKIFKKNKIKLVINLAAQPGVRVSYEKPYNTMCQNILTFMNLIDLVRKYKIKNFIYASSSSVYGNTKILPFAENDKSINPASVYGASKLTNEIIANSYSKNYNIQCIGLRFFTVYGPYGRPDMAYYKFLLKNKKNKKIEIYNMGKMFRDFTFIDDVISAILKLIQIKKFKEKNIILNIGKGKPDRLIDLVNNLEKFNNLKFSKKFLNNYPKGDIKKTFSSTKKIEKSLKWKPKISLKDGIKIFSAWFKVYHK